MPHLQVKTLSGAGKNSSWFVTCFTDMIVCINHKRKCLWKGRLMSLCGSFVTFTSHFFMFSPKSWWLPSTWNLDCLIVCVKVHGSLSYRLFLQDNNLYSLYHAFTNHVTIILWERVVRWSPMSPMVSFCCVCVQERGCWTLAPFFVTASLH